MTALADKKRCTPAQLAIVWLLAQGEDIIPIPGTKRIKYLEENWDSVKVQLTDGEAAETRKLVESTKVTGARTLEAAMSSLYADTREE